MSWLDCLAHFLQVHKQNRTKLAEIVRDSYYGQLDPKVLSRVSPLELVIEVGFDKLFRDYTDLFLCKCSAVFHDGHPFKSVSVTLLVNFVFFISHKNPNKAQNKTIQTSLCWAPQR